MDPTTAAQLEACFARHPEVRLALVFGSVAAGRARPDSDIDVAVSAGKPLSTGQRVALMQDLAEATGRPVDLVDLLSAGYVVMREAVTRGARVVPGTAADRARVLSRMWGEEADYMPYYRRMVAKRLERIQGDAGGS
jgi:predicted nucleotidyltransferase